MKAQGMRTNGKAALTATPVGRVHLDYSEGCFSVENDPDEATPDSRPMYFWVMPQTLEQQRLARKLRVGDLVTLGGPCVIHRLDDPAQTDAGQTGVGLGIRTAQLAMPARPRPGTPGPSTWARLTVTARTCGLPAVEKGPALRGFGVTVPTVFRTDEGLRIDIFAWLEGDDAPARAGMEPEGPDGFRHTLVLGTWVSYAGRLGHALTPEGESILVVETQVLERA